MKTKKISKFLEFIRTEPRLNKVEDGFLYYDQYFTNEQLIKMYEKNSKRK